MKPETITEKLQRTKKIDNDLDYRRAEIRHQRLGNIDPDGLTKSEEDEYHMLDGCLYDFEKNHGSPFRNDQRVAPATEAEARNQKDQ